MKKGKKILALVLAALMVVTILPFTMFSGLFTSKAKADDANLTYTFSAEKELAALEKKANIDAGTKYADFFTTVGSTKRANMDAFAIDIGKAGTDGLEFTVPEGYTASVKVSARGAGGTKVATIELNSVAKDFDASAVGSQTWYELVAGKYTIVSKDPNTVSGGARITEVVVTLEKNVTLEPISATFSAEKELAALEKKANIDAGTKYADFFTTVGSTKRANMDAFAIDIGKAGTDGLEFTVPEGYTASVKVSARGAGGTKVATIELNSVAKDFDASNVGTQTWNDLVAGKYTIISKDPNTVSGGARITEVVVDMTPGSTAPKKEKTPWSEIAAPTVTAAQSDGKIDVTSNAYVDAYKGCDSVTFVLTSPSGEETTKKIVSDGEAKHSFEPKASGKYAVKAIISRENEEDKTGETIYVDFVLPIAKPAISSITGHADGSATIVWGTVKEATSYKLEYKVKGAEDSTYAKAYEGADTTATITGLTAGDYTIKVTASRGEDSASITADKTFSGNAERTWSFSAFGGSGCSLSKNYTTGGVYSNDLYITSSSTKINGNYNPDQIATVFTALDAQKENFTLTATFTIGKNSKPNGGQSGFGVIAMDSVGESGTEAIYNTNSIYTYVGKVDFKYDQETLETKASDASTGIAVTMYEGVGARFRTGTTSTETVPSSVVTYTLEKSAVGKEAATNKYNAFGRDSYVSGDERSGYEATDTIGDTIRLQIKKDNTGYLCSYLDIEGNVISSQRMYDFDNSKLTQIDKDHIYVGFFAARDFEVTVTDVKLETIAPEDDAPAEEIQYEYIDVTSSITTSSTSSKEAYILGYVANADGHVIISNEEGNVIMEQDVLAKQTYYSDTYPLTLGKNKFFISFTPNQGYQPKEYALLSSYETVESTFTVTYRTYGDATNSLYVAPGAFGSGSKDDPMSIYDAVKYVQQGQQIICKEGTYKLESAVKVNRGVNGTEQNMIVLMKDPEATSNPVFDFSGMSAGFIFAGDYWYVKDIDVTNSANKMKAVQVSGNHNILDGVNAYNNGDTGIQISRLLATDVNQSMWPSYNTILNCSSYNNSDISYQDADGFAAKITVGVGNQFIGCISHSNADDGWDLFAYPDTGSIGKVRIYNCVAYDNGYVYKNAEGKLDINGTKVDAGNGNGFKLGGNSISGYHELENSVAWGNKAKGIDCNSCPDIQVKNCISYNNESYNVALYTSANNTDFSSTGVISYKTDYKNTLDTDGDYKSTTGLKGIKLKGSQKVDQVANETSYYWTGESSSNTAGVKVEESWFKSIDMANAKVTRNADGSINLNGFLELTDKAPANAGARLVSTPSNSFTAAESIKTYKTVSVTGSNASRGLNSALAFVKGTETDLTWTFDANGATFDYLLLDDVVLEPTKYSINGNVITVNASVLKKLGAGDHNFRAMFKDGMFVEIRLEVAPDTGDMVTGRTIYGYVLIMILALMAAAAVVFFEKKRKMAR